MAEETSKPKPRSKTRLLKRKFPDHQSDIDFWQKKGPEAIWEAAFEMMETAYELEHGKKPVFQRNVTRVIRGQI